ncbi:helix-turn-helix transcriptional regulator [Streptomyces sp. TRM 70351]|uniref:helix-turn-helix transcriptional regulator n=1 Tax=Streptomyces sp. TRM 70351 TaxID=3116552 RepID=UPI002E7B3E27|nr:helix-turn-helix transcriptional regulator [Streptomyces sp. TRM 70351]MEE1928090.1 helix-turn-helix transcriptional regulator [Streptomyces sp. TRM 70351]
MYETGEIDAATSRIYRLRVMHATESLERIATRAGVTPQEAAAAESRLAALGLLQPAPSGGWAAVSPETAADTLLAAAQREVLERQSAIAATRARLHALTGEYLEARSLRSDKGSIEIIEGIDSIRSVIDDLARHCSSSVDALIPGGGLDEAAISSATRLDRETLARGVRMRTLLQHSARKHPPTARYAAQISAAGARIRSTGVLPSRILIADNESAVLPVDPEDHAAGVVLVRDPAVLSFLRRLFEHHWDRGLEFTAEEQENGPEPTQLERDVLLLLAAGKKNDVIAHQLGISPRSVSRIVAHLMDRLGATSRFQAGVRAAMNGWIS